MTEAIPVTIGLSVSPEGIRPAGQRALVPLQLSATSQSPAGARHTAPAFPGVCSQASLVPLH